MRSPTPPRSVGMKLSVIIVSYKVPYFLEQTLLSAQRAAQHVPTELIVVDNNSQDGTVALVQERFPNVRLWANTQNTGFAKANNQGLEWATGQYVLFLNPDTAVQEDTFVRIVDFMDAHPEAGGLGVHMIDGTGTFLPESKRGFPSPLVAFYKTFGLAALFPKSRRFGEYHLGYLSAKETHQVPVLSGAFMLVPKAVLEQVGTWDEAFFMYGEDIDLSYRIVQGGYQNYYYADTTIIHYKGESTKKGSLNYVKTFYEAMIIFARKHFQGSKAGLFVLMLQLAIYFRAFLTLLSNLGKRGFLLILDALLIYGGLWGIKDIWAQIRFHDPTYYHSNAELVTFNFPLYVALWLTGIYLRGGYDRQARSRHLITGTLLGTIVITCIYAFLPQYLRSSRMLILLGSLWTIAVTYSTRALGSLLRNGTLFWSQSHRRHVAIVGSAQEAQRVLNLLYQAHVSFNYRGRIGPTDEAEETDYLGETAGLVRWIRIYEVDELIFCGADLSYQTIVAHMLELGQKVRYKIVPEGSPYIIGSDSKNSAGDLYTVHTQYNIANSIHLRNKRLLDLVYTIGLLLLFPVLWWGLYHKAGYWANCWAVLRGHKTWVGYAPEAQLNELPSLPTAVLTPLDAQGDPIKSPQTIQRLNRFYAKDYNAWSDWTILSKAWRYVGRSNPTPAPQTIKD